MLTKFHINAGNPPPSVQNSSFFPHGPYKEYHLFHKRIIPSKTEYLSKGRIKKKAYRSTRQRLAF